MLSAETHLKAAAALAGTLDKAKEARRLIDEALSTDPKHVQGLSYLGMLEMRSGNRGPSHRGGGFQSSGFMTRHFFTSPLAPLPTRPHSPVRMNSERSAVSCALPGAKPRFRGLRARCCGSEVCAVAMPG